MIKSNEHLRFLKPISNLKHTLKLITLSLMIGLAVFSTTRLLNAQQRVSSGGAGGLSEADQSFSCGGCHGGGAVPTVGLTGPTTVEVNTTSSYALSIQSNDPANQVASGFVVAIRDASNNTVGSFVITDAATQIQDNDLTHLFPAANDMAGLRTFNFDWIAPTTPGTYTLYYSGNAVDQNGNPGGDGYEPGTITLDVTESTAVTLSTPPTTQGASSLFSYSALTLLLLVGTLTQLWRQTDTKHSDLGQR